MLFPLERAAFASAPAAPPAFDQFLVAWRPLVPIPGLLLVLPLVYLFFRSTWREIDEEAHRWYVAAACSVVQGV